MGSILFVIFVGPNKVVHPFFAMHVVCMCSAFLVFMVQGIMAYTAPPDQRSLSRASHMLMQGFSALLVVGGVAGILIHRWRMEKQILSLSYHAFLGWLVLAALVVQVVVGVAKVRLLESGVRRFPWHGLLGWGILAGGCFVLCLGILTVTTGVILPLLLLAGVFLLFVWTGFAFRRAKQAAAAYSPVPTDQEGGEIEMGAV